MGRFIYFLFLNVFSWAVAAHAADVFPYHESFETGSGRWILVESPEGRYWNRHSGPTWSLNTGPNVAHDRDYFMYMEASTPEVGYPSKTIEMRATFDVSSLTKPLFSFRYHMYGATMGTLTVDVNSGSGWVNVFTRSGQQHTTDDAVWTLEEIDLSSYISSSLQIRFVATSGSSWQSDICVDDFWLIDDEVQPHSFAWSAIGDRQTHGVAFPVEIRALNYVGQTMTTFNEAVEITGWSDGFSDKCQNRDFNGGSLSYWTPLNAGPTPGPYEVVDSVFGDGKAFRLIPNSTFDGIQQEMTLTGGENYYLSASYCLKNFNTGQSKTGVFYGRILVNGVSVAQCSVTSLGENSQHSHRITGIYTPPADGTYTISLVASGSLGEDNDLRAYFDDVSVNFAPAQYISITPGISGQFVNGVWTGNVTVNHRLPGIHLIARYSDTIGTSDIFSTYTSPLDMDGDGLLDSWELTYFPTTAACNSLDDPDGDGYCNADEYIIGSVPTLKSSSLNMSAEASSSSQQLVKWFSVSGRSYDVQWTPNIQFTPFTDLATGIPHPHGAYTNDTATTGNVGFFRVKVRKN